MTPSEILSEARASDTQEQKRIFAMFSLLPLRDQTELLLRTLNELQAVQAQLIVQTNNLTKAERKRQVAEGVANLNGAPDGTAQG